jgi:hypothetical protein
MNKPLADPPSDATPRRVLLFSGHMIDAPDRAVPRFPPDKEPIAREAVARLLDELEAGPEDTGICGGACGGDLLFAEAALARGIALELYLPFNEAAFLAQSVDYAEGAWRARYIAVRAACSLLYVAPGDGTFDASLAGANPFEQNNARMLEAAIRFGAERVDFICLWDGRGSDGPGGTQHLMQEVTRQRGRTHWLDTTRLWD